MPVPHAEAGPATLLGKPRVTPPHAAPVAIRENERMRLIVGIIGGTFVAVVVCMFSAFFLRSMFGGMPVLDVVFGLVIPIVLGLLAGAHSFRASVRRVGNNGRAEP